MKLLRVFILVLVATGAHAFDFKGLEVGGPTNYQPAQVEAALNQVSTNSAVAGSVKCGIGYAARQVCNGATSVSGVYARTNTVVSPEGVVMRIELVFAVSDFETVQAGVTGKFGAPTRSSNSAVQNRMGATFQNVVLIWHGTNGKYIRLSKYAGNIDDSQLFFGSAQDTAAMEELDKPDKTDL